MVSAPVIELSSRGRSILMMMSLRAACELVAAENEPMRGASVTFTLHGGADDALALLRRVESIAEEYGLRHRVEVHGRLATVHIWRVEVH